MRVHRERVVGLIGAVGRRWLAKHPDYTHHLIDPIRTESE